jgi:hypothetical protein
VVGFSPELVQAKTNWFPVETNFCTIFTKQFFFHQNFKLSEKINSQNIFLKFEIVLKKQPLNGKTNKVFSLRKLVKQKKPNTKIVNTFIFIF